MNSTIEILNSQIEALRDENYKLRKLNEIMADHLVEMDECFYYEGNLLWKSCGEKVGGDDL